MGGQLLSGRGVCAVDIVSTPASGPFVCADVALVNHDDFMSRYRMTNIGREEVLLDL